MILMLNTLSIAELLLFRVLVVVVDGDEELKNQSGLWCK